MRYAIADWNVFLATRERGRRVREAIEHKLAEIAAGETLTMDFSGVEGITVSFGDECLAKLLLARDSGDYDDRGLLIEGANEDVQETLETILIRRKLAAVCVMASGDLCVIGNKRWLPETFDAALDLRSFTAADLASRLGLSPQAANNRLRALVAAGGVARELGVPEGGGKEFSYKIAAPAYA